MKKTETFGFRLSEELKAELNEVAPYYGTSAGQLASVLIETFLKCHKKRKGRIVWPPGYLYYPETWDKMDGKLAVENYSFVKKVFSEEMKEFAPEFGKFMREMNEYISGLPEEERKEFFKITEEKGQPKGNRGKKPQ